MSRATQRTGRRGSIWKRTFKVLGVILLLVLAAGAGAGLSLLQRFNGQDNILTTIRTLGTTAGAIQDPRRQFPGKDRIVILCLGLDRNIVRSRDPRINGMPTTRDSRSDVMMIASLDLANQSVSILSIPRDTRVKLPGRRSYSKINEAHARGGIPYTRQAVEEFLGMPVDYHVVIKQEAIQSVVDSLGGVTVDVEKSMDYDDSWGQLHIHLKEGEQLLDGEQVVGYMRFRHDPEGDFGRIRRQQQVIQALAGQVKRPEILVRAASLITAIREYVKTDLSPEQQLALATLFHKTDTNQLVTVQLPVSDTATVGGVSYVIPDDGRKQHVVDWILRGSVDAMNPLVRVELKNASGDPELYQKVYRVLRHAGFLVWRAGKSREALTATRVLQRGSMKGSGNRVMAVLGLKGTVEALKGSGPEVTLLVGQDLAGSTEILFADTLEDLPDSPRSFVRRIDFDDEGYQPRRRRARQKAEAPLKVEVKSLETPEEKDPGTEPPLEIPGSADPGTPPPPPIPDPAGAPGQS